MSDSAATSAPGAAASAATSSPGAAATVVLVHGSWHGPWAWDKVVPLLEAEGIRTITPALPSMGHDRASRGDLHDDAAVVKEAVASAGGPVVLVGHSYAGAVITEAAAGDPAVRRLVYISAIVPDEGESLFDALTLVDELLVGPGSGLQVNDEDFSHRLEPGREIAILYHDCEPADAAAAVARLVPQNAVTGTQELRGHAYRTTPSTYFVCADDRTISPKLQRLVASRMTDTVEWDTSHSPMLSQPQLVADALAELAR